MTLHHQYFGRAGFGDNIYDIQGIGPLCHLRGMSTNWCFSIHPFTLIVYLCLLDRIIREVSDICTLKFSYFTACENYLQILIIASTSMFIFIAHSNVEFATHAAAWAILFTWIDFTFQLGRLNNMGEYLFMVVTVGKKCLVFLLLYLPVMIAFAFGFNILMHQVPSYSGFFSSFIRVFAHLNGEMEFSDHFVWHEIKQFGASLGSTQIMFVFCTIIFTIVIANLLIAMTIEASQKLKEGGDQIQSEYKYRDILSRSTYLLKLFSCCRTDKSQHLMKIGMHWTEYLKHQRTSNLFTPFIDWLKRGGTVQLYNVESPNAKVATGLFIEGKYILSLKAALDRKEMMNKKFNKELQEIKKKGKELNMKTLIALFAKKEGLKLDGADDE